MESVADALHKEGWLKGKKEGIKEGVKEGKKEGIKEGIEKERVLVAKNMISNGMKNEIIHKITGFSYQKIDILRKEVEK